MTKINATLEDIRPRFDAQHPANKARVQAIIDSLTVGHDEYGDPIYREWDLAPVVVIEDEGNGYAVLDGHHRLAAAKQLELTTIPAWVVSVADYCRLIEAEFDGSSPNRLQDVREYIMCGDVTANDICDHGNDVVSI